MPGVMHISSDSPVDILPSATSYSSPLIAVDVCSIRVAGPVEFWRKTMKKRYVVIGIALVGVSTMWAATNITCDTLVVNGSQAQGGGVASGLNSTAEGSKTRALGAYSHAEGLTTIAAGKAAHAEGSFTVASNSAAHAEGAFTEAYSAFSHAGGIFARVKKGHRGAFIHAAGSAAAIKESLYSATAHFDRLIVFEEANDDSRSVLSRSQNDVRYASSAQGTRANAALIPYSPRASLVVSNVHARGTISADRPAIADTDVVRKGEMDTAIIEGVNARIPEFQQVEFSPGERLYSIRENLTCSLAEFALGSYAGGYDTAAENSFAWSGGIFTRALHEGSFIFSRGEEGSYRTTYARNTAHFDRLHTFEPANDSANSVLNRGEGDGRYARLAYLSPQGDLGMGIYTNYSVP